MKQEKQDSRVLGRVGARELTREEVTQVEGGLRMASVCTKNHQVQDMEC